MSLSLFKTNYCQTLAIHWQFTLSVKSVPSLYQPKWWDWYHWQCKRARKAFKPDQIARLMPLSRLVCFIGTRTLVRQTLRFEYVELKCVTWTQVRHVQFDKRTSTFELEFWTLRSQATILNEHEIYSFVCFPLVSCCSKMCDFL